MTRPNWSSDVARAQWWVDRLGPWHGDTDDLRHIVPGGFDAVARILHPVEVPERGFSTWTELADANGRVAHAEMQLHAIVTPRGVTPDFDSYDGPHAHIGELPEPETTLLAAELARWTATPDDCWFAVWDGYGHLHGGGQVATYDSPIPWRTRLRLGGRSLSPSTGIAPDDIRMGERVHTDGRDYFLLSGALARIDEAAALLGGQPPNLWWPADRSWIVVSEIDFAWTYVAGSEAMVSAVEHLDGLEVFRSDYSHACTYRGDTLNR